MPEILLLATLLSITVVALVLGAELMVAALRPVLDAVHGARSATAVHLGRLMPFGYLPAILFTSGTVAARLLLEPEPPVATLMVAMVSLIATMGISLGVLVPINTRIGAGEAGPGEIARWDRWHLLRCGLLALAAAALIGGLLA